MKVTFLGAGAYGKALGDLAESNGHIVKYYDPYKFPDIKLASALENADLAVYVAPAGAVNEIVPELPEDLPVLCASKGITTPYPFRHLKHFSALAGAAFAEDIATDTPRLGDKILLTASTPLAEELFTAPKIGIEYFEDTHGIMLMASLKVAVSIYAGYRHPEGFVEDSTKSFTKSSTKPFTGSPTEVAAKPSTKPFTKTKQTLSSKQTFLEEIRPEYEKWLDLNGCSRDLMQLSCGFPDVIISTTPTSRNFALGQAIAKAGKIPARLGTVEGLTFYQTLQDYPDLKIPDGSVLIDFYEKELKPTIEASNAAGKEWENAA